MAEYNTIFKLAEFKPYRAAWDARRTELKRRRKYYDGTMYSDLTDKLGWLAPRMGKEIKPLFLPLARAVDVDAGIIPGGWTLGDEEVSETVVQSWTDAQAFLFKASGWQHSGRALRPLRSSVRGCRIADGLEQGERSRHAGHG